MSVNKVMPLKTCNEN